MLSTICHPPRLERQPWQPRPTYCRAPSNAGPERLAWHLSEEAAVVALSFEQYAATGEPATWGDFMDFRCGASVDAMHLAERLDGRRFNQTRLALALFALHSANRRFSYFAHELAVAYVFPCTCPNRAIREAAKVAASLRGLQRLFAETARSIQ